VSRLPLMAMESWALNPVILTQSCAGLVPTILGDQRPVSTPFIVVTCQTVLLGASGVPGTQCTS